MKLADELRSIEAFREVPPEGLEWLASHMTVREFAEGDVVSREGDAAEYMSVLLEGELRAARENGGDDGRRYTAHAGQVTGMLPFSRLERFPLTSRAAVASRIAFLHKSEFPEMLQRFPELQAKLVNVMADRIRETTADAQQRDKLSALGKLAAGLAHELNNPAAAARRAAQTLREAVEELRRANVQLDELDLASDQRRWLAAVEQDLPGHAQPLDTLERSDREQQIAEWLEQREIPQAWELAGGLVDAGADENCLREVEQRFPREAVGCVLVRLSASSTVRRLVDEIENSTGRISDLVRAVKEYSYMDQMPEQEVDLHHGLESTLLILKHRWKNGVRVVREYDRDLPPVCAKGSELNQVWTNLIDNAIDAMQGKGVLRVRTARELDHALVEIVDSGPGIPREIQSRIFDPFFTTKGVGEGSGLGLDTAYRIVRAHRGEIRFDTSPGETRFQVRLPLARSSPPKS